MLKNSDLSLMRLLGCAVHNMYFLSYTRLIEKDDCIAYFYIVEYGIIDVKHPEDPTNTITKLPTGR